MTDFGDDVGDIIFNEAKRRIEDYIRFSYNDNLRQYTEPDTGKVVNEFDFHSEEQRNAVLNQLSSDGVPIHAVGDTKVIFYQEDTSKVIAGLENYNNQITKELEHPPIDIDDKDYESIAAAQAAREEQEASIELMYRERGFEDASNKAAAAVGVDKLSDALRENPNITKETLSDQQSKQSAKIEPLKDSVEGFGMKPPRVKAEERAMRAASAQLAGEKTVKTREMQIDKKIPSR